MFFSYNITCFSTGMVWESQWSLAGHQECQGKSSQMKKMTVRVGLLHWDLEVSTSTRFKQQTRSTNRKIKVSSLIIIIANIYWEVSMDSILFVLIHLLFTQASKVDIFNNISRFENWSTEWCKLVKGTQLGSTKVRKYTQSLDPEPSACTIPLRYNSRCAQVYVAQART